MCIRDRDLDDNVYLNDDGSVWGRRPDAYLKGLARSTGDRIQMCIRDSLQADAQKPAE